MGVEQLFCSHLKNWGECSSAGLFTGQALQRALGQFLPNSTTLNTNIVSQFMLRFEFKIQPFIA